MVDSNLPGYSSTAAESAYTYEAAGRQAPTGLLYTDAGESFDGFGNTEARSCGGTIVNEVYQVGGGGADDDEVEVEL